MSRWNFAAVRFLSSSSKLFDTDSVELNLLFCVFECSDCYLAQYEKRFMSSQIDV